MAHKVHIPKLSMTMAEARLVEWKVEEGEWVEKGQDLLKHESREQTANEGPVPHRRAPKNDPLAE